MSSYKQAVEASPSNSSALYGLAACDHALGDTAGEIASYRAATYGPAFVGQASDGTPLRAPIVFRENDPERLMNYVLLLSRNGQADEALSVYRHAAGQLRSIIQVPLPDFGGGAGQVLYTPRRLQAMALVGLSVGVANQGSTGEPVREANLGEAARLYPDSAVPWFYLGEQMSGAHPDEARAAYQKATEREGDPARATARAALVRLPPPGQVGHLPAPAAVRQLLGLEQDATPPTVK